MDDSKDDARGDGAGHGVSSAEPGARSAEPGARSAEPGAPAVDFLESSPYPQIAYTFDLEILAVNAHHGAMTGVAREALIGRRLFDAFPANPHEPDANAEAPLRESVARMRETGAPDAMPIVKHDIEVDGKPGAFEARYWQIVHSPLMDADGRMVGALQTTRDVTGEVDRRHIEEARRRSAEAAGKLQFWGVDLDTGEILRSAGLDQMFDFQPGHPQTLDTFVERLHPEDRPAFLNDIDAAARADVGTSFDTDYRIVRSDGSMRHVNSLAELLVIEGRRRLTGVLIDTTVIHRREDALRRMVEEKQTLLADVNHRVKNSLQLVTSLLHIEERAASGGAAEQLHRTAGRVAAIAAVHASLYHYADMSRVNVSEHLRTFCGQITDDHDGRLRLELEDEPLFLSAEKAVPLALLVNEIISDSLGNIGSSDEEVLVKLEYDGPRLLLRVENAVKRADTKPGPLGTRLFQALLEQLDGSFSQGTTDGCNACLEFRRT